MPIGRSPHPPGWRAVLAGGDDDKPPLTDKDYVLIGVTAVEHSTTVLKRWPYCPTVQEVEKRIAGAKKDYDGFALCGVVGMYAPPRSTG